MSIGVALTIRKALANRTAGIKGPKLLIFNSISTGAAIGTAGFVNAYLMRQTEIKKGIDIFDPNDSS